MLQVIGRAALGLVCLIAATACQSAVDFRQPVSVFATASRSADTVLTQQHAVLEQENARRLTQIALMAPRTLSPKDDSCQLGATRCRLGISNSSVSTATMDYPGSEITSQSQAVMAALIEYVSRLEQITTASSYQEIEQASQGALLSVVDVAKKGDELTGTTTLASKVMPFSEPIQQTVTLVASRVVERHKLSRLRDATSAMQLILPDAMLTLTTAARQGWEIQKSRFDDQFAEARLAYGLISGPATMTQLTAFLEAAKAYDLILSSDPGLLFASMSEAHTALAAAVRDNSLGSIDVWQKLNAFVADAQRIAGIVALYREAFDSAAEN
jgi:hypothetical protein